MAEPRPAAPAACPLCGSSELEPVPGGRSSSSGWPRRCVGCRSLGHDRILHSALLALPKREFEDRRILILGSVPFREDDRFTGAERMATGRPLPDLLERVDRLVSYSYDWILCHHVLQYVEGDRELHRELYRRLSPTGVLVLTVPGTATRTVSRETVGAERFGGVVKRVYGRDAAAHLAGGDCRMLYDEYRRIDLPTAEEESLFIWSRSPERLGDMQFYLAARDRPVHCSLCGYPIFEPGPRGRLSSRQQPPRCGSCGSLERDRIVSTVWQALPTSYRADLRVLHTSDDRGISKHWFASYERRLYGRRRGRIDLERIKRPDGAYDALICNYVLGQVPDDDRAFREILRVLAPDGFLQLMVPGLRDKEKTVEFRAASEAEFGNYRSYGRDLVDRFSEMAPETGWLLLRQRDPVTSSDDLVLLWTKQAQGVDRFVRFLRAASIPIVASSNERRQAVSAQARRPLSRARSGAAEASADPSERQLQIERRGGSIAKPERRDWRTLVKGVGRLRSRVASRRQCPVCGRDAESFRRFGLEQRADAQCPHCGALERHRLIWLFIERRTDLLVPPVKRLLHVAPERQLAPLLRSRTHLRYVSADLESPLAQVRLDLTRLPFREATFDAVLCNHVLEHIPDDRAAMSELLRSLKPGGWAILQVPMKGAVTVEDPAVVDPEERKRRFGQADHVRMYGRDYEARLEGVGFEVEACPYARELPADEVERFALKNQTVYFCRRQAERTAPD